MPELTDVREFTPSIWQKVHSWFAQQLNDQKPIGTIAALDGVRALAFLLVFGMHMNHASVWGDDNNPYISALFSVGRTGVTLFFILSGFLLFLPYVQALLFKKEWPQAKIYYIRRILRIFPGYFFSLFIFVMFTQSQLIQPHNWKQLIPFLTFTMGYNASASLNGPYWTLAVEFQYYLLLPLIALGILGLTRLVRPEKRLWVVVGSLFAMIFWGLMTSRYGPYFYNHPNQTILIPRSLFKIVLFIAYGDHGKFMEYFAVGMLIAVGYLSIMNSPRKEYYLRRTRQILPWFLIPFIALYIYAGMPHITLPYIPHVLQFQSKAWLNEFAFVLCYGYLVTIVLFNRPGGWLGRIFSWTPLRWLGLISYSLYIWHRPLIQILARNLGPSLHHMNIIVRVSVFWMIVFPVCVVFCFVLFVLIEKPGMRLSEKLRQQIKRNDAKKQTPPDSNDAYALDQMDTRIEPILGGIQTWNSQMYSQRERSGGS